MNFEGSWGFSHTPWDASFLTPLCSVVLVITVTFFLITDIVYSLSYCNFSQPVFCRDWGYSLSFQQKRETQTSRKFAHVLQTHLLHILPMLHTYRQALLVMEHMCSSPEVMDNTSVNCADLIVLCGWLCYAPSDNDCALLWLWGSDLK